MEISYIFTATLNSIREIRVLFGPDIYRKFLYQNWRHNTDSSLNSTADTFRL
jgi:hypothetical protein